MTPFIDIMEMVKIQKTTLDSIEFYRFSGEVKSLIFSKESYNEDEISVLFSFFIAVIKESSTSVEGFEDFLISRDYLYEDIYDEVEAENLRTVFILLEQDLNDMYLCKVQNPSTKNIMRYFASIVKV